ncbi:toll-like receptor 3 isoform X2 [Danaus plexippus]|uniref:toll-like receptor 3 isoform X2 n=1 Tax=Danaus plexippus TaxID=13037 RepID=UPI002AB23EB3|nr:toll-like receptor 3 isoform X2 [Danaus plexippus]
MTYHQNGFSKMVLAPILFSCFFANIVNCQISDRCLSGYMTDIQSWVDRYGYFTANVDFKSKLDLSGIQGPMLKIERYLKEFELKGYDRIKYFSMTKCGLRSIPDVFHLQDHHGRSLAETIEYVTFYGNEFSMNYLTRNDDYDVSPEVNLTSFNGEEIIDKERYRYLSSWGAGFKDVNFENLLQLDLRACGIRSLGSYAFKSMPKLSMLYLSENNIYHIEADTFSGLQNLIHLDLSRNDALDDVYKTISFNFENRHEFRGLRLVSLDLSYSPFGDNNIPMLKDLKQLKSLSLCFSGLRRLRPRTFDGTQLRFLDVSGNKDIFDTRSVLGGLENSLQVLYAQEVNMKTIDCLYNLTYLEIAQLRKNEIAVVRQNVSITLKKLQVLDLSHNRKLAWFSKVFSLMPKLKLLSLNSNNMNVVTQEMLDDFQDLSYVDLSYNFLICSCALRDIYGISINNEYSVEHPLIEFERDNEGDTLFLNNGLTYFNNIITRRQNTSILNGNRTLRMDNVFQLRGNFVLLVNKNDPYRFRCLIASEGKLTNVNKIMECTNLNRNYDIEQADEAKWRFFLLFLIPVLLLPTLIFMYMYRRNFKYFWINLKNTTTLSLINKDVIINDTTIFNYDAFISYCNEDRAWVLDYFLPHVEQDCNISVCLHERDFQVGLSILENIVSCMDRSRSIILIISKRFLLSQWCQFEMHLAQHRLLETRREDLILVLLEEIPRRLRPNTLHYLMVTKTYIVWPSEEPQRNLFWKQLKKSIVKLKLIHSENVSLA